ncbi:hypothetical protein Pelo_6699 [Pelomyxa schiedti]|nr:hypothetical protein Pelo_6699 [Pelomyxa schiedti]
MLEWTTGVSHLRQVIAFMMATHARHLVSQWLGPRPCRSLVIKRASMVSSDEWIEARVSCATLGLTGDPQRSRPPKKVGGYGRIPRPEDLHDWGYAAVSPKWCVEVVDRNSCLDIHHTRLDVTGIKLPAFQIGDDDDEETMNGDDALREAILRRPGIVSVSFLTEEELCVVIYQVNRKYLCLLVDVGKSYWAKKLVVISSVESCSTFTNRNMFYSKVAFFWYHGAFLAIRHNDEEDETLLVEKSGIVTTFSGNSQCYIFEAYFGLVRLQAPNVLEIWTCNDLSTPTRVVSVTEGANLWPAGDFVVIERCPNSEDILVVCISTGSTLLTLRTSTCVRKVVTAVRYFDC